MTRTEKARLTRQRNAAIKQRALRQWRKDRLADLARRLAAFTNVRKLTAIKRMADDKRGDANVRAVAAGMAKKFESAAHTARKIAG